jgi:predicted acyl esterase
MLEDVRTQDFAMCDQSYRGGNYSDGSFFDDGSVITFDGLERIEW